MSVLIKAITCPQCGATVKCEEGREKLFCSYCGTLIVVSNDNEHIYRHIDEADIKRAETERIETLANIRANEEKANALSTSKLIRLIIIGILGALAILFIIIGAIDNPLLIIIGMLFLEIDGFIGLSFIPGKKRSNNTQNSPSRTKENGIRINSAIEEYQDCNYESISSLLKSIGFYNITCIPLKDLNTPQALSNMNGKIEFLSINGEENIRSYDVFPADAKIIITYHSSPNENTPDINPASFANNSDNTSKESKSTGMNQSDIRCSSCGGTMRINSDSGLVSCPFCGNYSVNPSLKKETKT